MVPNELDQPFDSIESAHDFMHVLGETVLDAMQELKRQHQIALRDGETRRAQAIDIAQYKLKNLNCYVTKSKRALNDLRMIRRLILNERATVDHVLATM